MANADWRTEETGGIVRIRGRGTLGGKPGVRVTVPEKAEVVLDNRPESIRLVLTDELRQWMEKRPEDWHAARRIEPQTPRQRTAELRQPFRTQARETERWNADPHRLELGLVFRERAEDRETAAKRVQEVVERIRGTWLGESTIAEIHYHAALVAVPKAQAVRLRDQPDTSPLARCTAIMTMGPELVATAS